MENSSNPLDTHVDSQGERPILIPSLHPLWKILRILPTHMLIHRGERPILIPSLHSLWKILRIIPLIIPSLKTHMLIRRGEKPISEPDFNYETGWAGRKDWPALRLCILRIFRMCSFLGRSLESASLVVFSDESNLREVVGSWYKISNYFWIQSTIAGQSWWLWTG